jgi:hypothetical protein
MVIWSWFALSWRLGTLAFFIQATTYCLNEVEPSFSITSKLGCGHIILKAEAIEILVEYIFILIRGDNKCA